MNNDRAIIRQCSTTTLYALHHVMRIAVLLFSSVLLLLLSQTAVYPDPLEDMKHGEEAYRSADIVSAITWFRKAAETGHAPAQSRLATMLDHSENNEEAVIWYQKAAEQNNADGQYGLGSMYASGDGIAKDFEQAVKWFTLAADQGHSLAIRTIVTAYETGGLGLEVDTTKAEEILNNAAELNDSWAISRLKEKYQSNNGTDAGQ